MVGNGVERDRNSLLALISRNLVIEVAWKENEITRFGLRQNVFAGAVRSNSGSSCVVSKREIEAARGFHENRPAGGMRRGQIDDARDEAVRVGMQRLFSARLEHVGPHLLDRPT